MLLASPSPSVLRTSTSPARSAGEVSLGACVHCGLATAPGRRFCCPGCAAAFETIQTLGLGQYYRQRLLDPALRAPRPEATDRPDLARHIADRADGTHELTLAIDGLQCGACVWLIESVLAREPTVLTGRVNMTTSRLRPDLARRRRPCRAPCRHDRTPRLSPGAVRHRHAGRRPGPHRPRPDPGAGSRGVRRRQRHADFDWHLGRRPRRTAGRHGAGHALPAALGVGADSPARDRLCRYAVLRLRRRGPAACAHQHGRADQPGRPAGERHEPGADHHRRRAHLFQLRRHAAVLPADRPRAGPPRAWPGPSHRGTASDPAQYRRRGDRRRWQRHALPPARSGRRRPRPGRHGRAHRHRRRGGDRRVVPRRQPGNGREPAGRSACRHPGVRRQ